jgi:hypothetical protein
LQPTPRSRQSGICSSTILESRSSRGYRRGNCDSSPAFCSRQQMLRVFPIGLPISHPPKFAEECVNCGAPSPSSSIKVAVDLTGAWRGLPFGGTKHIVRAPACLACSWKHRLYRLAAIAIAIATAVILWFFVWPHLRPFFAAPWRRSITVPIAFLSAFVWLVADVFLPRGFDVTLMRKQSGLDYEFSSFHGAFEFWKANTASPWICLGSCANKEGQFGKDEDDPPAAGAYTAR